MGSGDRFIHSGKERGLETSPKGCLAEESRCFSREGRGVEKSRGSGKDGREERVGGLCRGHGQHAPACEKTPRIPGTSDSNQAASPQGCGPGAGAKLRDTEDRTRRNPRILGRAPAFPSWRLQVNPPGSFSMEQKGRRTGCDGNSSKVTI